MSYSTPFNRSRSAQSKTKSSKFITYYQVLGISSNSNQKDIEKAYKKQALKLHPDRNQAEDKEESTDQFQKLSEAYEILRDPTKRKKYDQRVLNSIALDLDLRFNQNSKPKNFENGFNRDQGSKLSQPSRKEPTFETPSARPSSASASTSARPGRTSFNYPDVKYFTANLRPTPPQTRSFPPPPPTTASDSTNPKERPIKQFGIDVSIPKSSARTSSTGFVKSPKNFMKPSGNQVPTYYFNSSSKTTNQFGIRRESTTSSSSSVDKNPTTGLDRGEIPLYGDERVRPRRTHHQPNSHHSEQNNDLRQSQSERLRTSGFGNRGKEDLLDEYVVFNSVWGGEDLESLSFDDIQTGVRKPTSSKSPVQTTDQDLSNRYSSPAPVRSFSLDFQGGNSGNDEHHRGISHANNLRNSVAQMGTRSKASASVGRLQSEDVKNLSRPKPKLEVLVEPSKYPSTRGSSNTPSMRSSTNSGFGKNDQLYNSPTTYIGSPQSSSKSSQNFNSRVSNLIRNEELMGKMTNPDGNYRMRSKSTSQADDRPSSLPQKSFKSYQKEYIIRICHEQDGSSKVHQELRSRVVGVDGSVINRYRRRRTGVSYVSTL
ncbi:hypothetical protein BY996DRAFT_6408063 [Phakopsora pachyrhizi]|nr:hypothetical protein BY996DRAFT_6408063 [Phakopsora pachyrhizi]